MNGRGLFLARRVAWALVVVYVVITFNFFLFRVLPGDPAKAGARDPRLSQASIVALTERFGLDKPVFVNLEEALVNTLWLILPAQLLAILLGTALGLAAAWRRGTGLDVVSLTFSLFMWSLPTFFLAILLLVFGASYLDLPTGGKVTIGAEYASFGDELADIGRHMAMPTLAFTLVLLGEYMLIMRSSVLDVFSEDYILTAKAKGLSTFRIIRDHALRNAMLPMVTLIAINLGFTVAGAIQVEEVFSWPGLGDLTVEAISQRDYPVLQGAFLLIAVAVVLANLAADLVYGWLDPRVTSA